MRDLFIAITAASYSGNKGAAAMLQSSISQLRGRYGESLNINLMSVYPKGDREQVPWDFVKIVPAKPEQLLFVAFPLALLCRVFRRCPPVRALLLKNKILKAYSRTDLVIDEAGISFVDDRGFVMNTYAFVCAAVPMLLGVPVVKYAQAMGPFKNPWNRFLAKWILPKMKLICARGKITEEHLHSIGIRENVRLCADGAFTMPDDPAALAEIDRLAGQDPFYKKADIVGVSLSSVVDKKCAAKGIAYREILVRFIDHLNELGYPVLIIANAAREGSEKTRNNDLMVCDDVFARVSDREMVRFEHREMSAGEIRARIGKCRFLVASRFHAMVGALEQKVPVLLVGWSHKYQEVLDFFDLGSCAIDFSKLTEEGIDEAFEELVNAEQVIRQDIEAHYEEVMESSRENVARIAEVIDAVVGARGAARVAGPQAPATAESGIVEPQAPAASESGAAGSQAAATVESGTAGPQAPAAAARSFRLLDYENPDRYIGPYLRTRMGYTTDNSIRKNAASGGVVTAFLSFLLERGEIDGAWVARADFENGRPAVHSFIATTREEILSASSSVYMDFPMLQQLDEIRAFPGRIAAVGTPCMLHGLTKRMERDSILKEKIVLRLGLFCSGNLDPACAELALKKAGIDTAGAKRLYFRRGHWRGAGAVVYEDGGEVSFSYAKTVCAYKNAYFFEKQRCAYCQDHFARWADISFGDIWLKEMKREEIKHTCVIIRSERADSLYTEAVRAGLLAERHVSARDVLRGQKRALVYKYCCARAKADALAAKGRSISLDTADPCRWNHRLAYRLSEWDRREAAEHPQRVARIPMNAVYLYMCFIRALLSF